MAQIMGKAVRLDEDERLVMRLDLALVGRVQSPAGSVTLDLIEEGPRYVSAVIPDAALSDFATAVLQACHIAQTPIPPGTPSGPVPYELPRAIPVQRVSVLTDPATSNAPVGHAVLELWVGEAPVQFLLPKQMILDALAGALEHVTPERQNH